MNKDLLKVLLIILGFIVFVLILVVVSFYLAKLFLLGDSPLEVPWVWIAIFSMIVVALMIRLEK